MTFQVTKDGDVKTGEFSELSFAGTGNGLTTNNYIDTGILASSITDLSVKFKYKQNTSGVYQGVIGATDAAYAQYFWLRHDSLAGKDFRFYFGSSSTSWTLTSLMLEDNVYTFTLTYVSGTTWNVTLYNHTIDSEVHNSNKELTGTVPDVTLYIYGRHLGTNTAPSYPTDKTIYNFSINGETWYMNKGTGTTIIGDQGTELTLLGTTTNFWNEQADVWNYANSLSGQKKLEYYGSFIAANTNTVDTGFTQEDLIEGQPIECVFKHIEGANTYIYNSREGTSNSFGLYNYNTSSTYIFASGNNSLGYTYSHSLFTVGDWYKIVCKVVGTDYVISMYKYDETTRIYSQIGSTYTVPITVVNTDNIHLSVRIASGAITNYYTQQIKEITIGGQTFNMNEGTGDTTRSTEKVLNIDGTITSFWQTTGENASNGLLKAPEFKEDYTYSGTGDGSTIKIDTGIIGNDIDEMEVKFRLPVRLEQTTYATLFGNIVTGGFFSCYLAGSTTWWCRFRVNSSATLFDFSSAVTEGEVYTIKVTKNTISNFTVEVRDIDEVVVYTNTAETGETSYGTINAWIYDRNYASSYPTTAEVFWYKINGETWHINNGTGSTVTSNEGTVHTVDGTLTNFWNESDIPNLDAQMKTYTDETKVKREIIEV